MLKSSTLICDSFWKRIMIEMCNIMILERIIIDRRESFDDDDDVVGGDVLFFYES